MIDKCDRGGRSGENGIDITDSIEVEGSAAGVTASTFSGEAALMRGGCGYHRVRRGIGSVEGGDRT